MSFKNLHTSGMTISFSNAPSFKVLFFLLFCFTLNTSFAQDCDNLTDGGTISGDEAGCNNPTFDPSTITSTAPATGGTGDIQYMWMKTTGDPNSPFNTWQIIPGATGESHDPTPITQTTYYGRCSRRSSCTEYIGETNFVTKTISCCNFNSAITPLAATICPKETLAMSVSATGTGLSYLWEASGGSFDNATIANPNYTMMMPGTYTIKVTISSTDCTEMIETTVTVDNSLTTTISADHDYIEVNENLPLNSTVSDANVTYLWTATGGTFNDNTIANPTYSNPSIGNYQIFLAVSNTIGCTAVDTFDIGVGSCVLVISGTTTEASCTGNDGTITITPSGAAGTVNYQWSQASIGNTATPTGLAAGSYTVTATDGAGCTANTTVTITGSGSNIVVTPTVTAASCGESNGTISLNITGGATPYTLQWDNELGNNPNQTGLAAGNYNVSVSDANGCSTATSVIVSEVSGISIMVISTPMSCIFANDATAAAMVAGATGAVSYAWSSNLGNSAMVTGLPAGTYTVTATDEAGCSATESITIASPAVLTAETTITSSGCGSTVGSATVIPTGGTAPYTYLWSDVNNQTSQTANDLSPGTYSVTVTDLGGCTVTSTATISADLGLMVTLATTNALCNGENSGSITANVANGTEPFTYTWNNSLPNLPGFTGLSQGTYRVTVTDANGCFGIAEAKVHSADALLVTPVTEDASCDGDDGRVRLDVSGGTPAYSYAWGAPLNNFTNIATGLAPGAYEFTVTDANGCSSADVIIIGQTTGCTDTCLVTGGLISTMDNTTICAGDGLADFIAVNLSGNTGENTQWVVTDEALNILELPTSNLFNFDGAGFGTCLIWSVSYTDAIGGLVVGQNAANLTGCRELSNSIRVVRQDCSPVDTCNVTPSTIATNDPTVFCVGDGSSDSVSINLTVGNGDFSRFIITDTTATIIAISSETIYDFETTAPGICLLWNITYNDGLNGLTIGNQINAIDGCFRLSNALTIIRQDCQPNPCSAFEGSVSINNPAGASICAKAEVSLSTTPSNAGYTYSWTATGGTFDNATSPTPTYSMMMPGTYSIIATIMDGTCVTTDTTDITILSGPEVILIATDNTCGGENIATITSTATGGQAPYTYIWSNGSTTADLTNLAAGTYNLTVTDANGCTVTSAASISDSGVISVAIATPNTVCGGSNTGTLSATITGGQAPFTYNWSNGGTTPTLTNLAAGTYNLTITDVNGCAASTTATILEATDFSVNIISNNRTVCPGESVSLGIAPANPNLTYTWTATGGSFDDANSSSPSYTMMTPGAYDITVVASNGTCTATSTTTITILQGINLSATLSDVVCAGDNNGAISITASSAHEPLTYNWDNGIGNISSPTGLAPGSYNVTITDTTNCSVTQSFTIGVTSNLSLDLTSANLNCNGANNGSITANATGGVAPITYTWSNGGANTATQSNLAAGTYSVTATDAMGCTQEQSIVLTEPTPIFVTIVNSAQGQILCPGTSVNLTATPNDTNLTYNWTATGGNFDDANIATPVYTMMMPGNYDITVIVSDGTCSYSATTNVIIGTGIDYTVNKTDISCPGETDGSISLIINSGAAPITYAWDGGIGNNPNPTGLAAGTYNLTLTDANNCQATTSVTIAAPNPIDIALDGTDILCSGDANGAVNALVVGGANPLALTWSNGANSTGIDNLTAGTYSLSVTDANGCTAVDSVTITESPALNLAAAGTNIGCLDGGNAYVTATGGTGPYTYLWNDGAAQTADTAVNLVAGDYSVTVTDANGCQATTTVSIQATAGISCSIVVINDIETLNGTEGELGVTVTGGSGNYTYSWNNGGTNSTITNLSTNTFAVTITDETGCSCIDSLTLLNPALLGNFVFIDTDSSGTQDTGEPGVEGVTLQLTGTTTYGDMIVRTTQTDENGFYQFSVPPGDYKVTVVDAFGYTFTSANTGGDDAIDSDFDPAMGMSQVVTLGPNESNLTIDLGLLVSDGCKNVLLGGAIQSDETLCSSDADPAIITNLSFPTGGMGQLEYLWLKSDITMEYYPGHPAWTEIPNSNSPDYDPGVITKTTYFIRCTRRSGCDSYPGESNIVTKTVIDCFSDPAAENLRTTIVDGHIALEWEGKIPYKNGHFIIEKSENGTDFKVCGTMESPISETMEAFHFMDDAPSFGDNYYRIKTLVPSMPINFSNIAMAKLKQNANQRVMIYPNPVQQQATIHFLEELDELAHVQIVSGYGQIVKTFEIDTANKRHQVDLSDLPSGMYYLKFSNRALKRFGHKIYKIEE